MALSSSDTRLSRRMRAPKVIKASAACFLVRDCYDHFLESNLDAFGPDGVGSPWLGEKKVKVDDWQIHGERLGHGGGW